VGVKGRLLRHRRDKGAEWTHLSVFEVHDNIRNEELLELEGRFRHIYRYDSRANRLSVAKRYGPLTTVRQHAKAEGWMDAPLVFPLGHEVRLAIRFKVAKTNRKAACRRRSPQPYSIRRSGAPDRSPGEGCQGCLIRAGTNAVGSSESEAFWLEFCRGLAREVLSGVARPGHEL